MLVSVGTQDSRDATPPSTSGGTAGAQGGGWRRGSQGEGRVSATAQPLCPVRLDKAGHLLGVLGGKARRVWSAEPLGRQKAQNSQPRGVGVGQGPGAAAGPRTGPQREEPQPLSSPSSSHL